MFEAFNLAGMEIPNRIVFSPYIENQSNREGTVTSAMTNYYLELAREGAGIIILESAYVARQGRAHVHQLGLSQEKQTEGLAKLIRQLQAEGAKVGVRLAHAGAKTSELICGEQPIGPSIINFGKDFDSSREFDEGDVEEIVLFFVHAAERAEEAGADFIEINGAQQFLLDQCLSNRFNNRYDDYGGAIDARVRLSLDIIKAINSRIAPEIPLSFLFSIHDKIEEGFSEDDLKGMLKLFQGVKLNLLHPFSIHVLNKFFDREETLLELTARYSKLPIIIEGNIKSPQILTEVIGYKKAELFSLDKALFTRPNWYSFLQRKIAPM